MTDFDRIGGEAAVRAILVRFVDRVFADPIIGFLFAGRDPARIALHEFEHAARHLGGNVAYTGRPIGMVHRPLRIHQGQFRRRIAVLRHVLRECGVEPEVVERWVDADQRLMALVTTPGDCIA